MDLSEYTIDELRRFQMRINAELEVRRRNRRVSSDKPDRIVRVEASEIEVGDTILSKKVGKHKRVCGRRVMGSFLSHDDCTLILSGKGETDEELTVRLDMLTKVKVKKGD